MTNTETVRIDKIVPGGQGMGRLEDGRVCFVWGALPGELVEFNVTKKKKSFSEGNILNVIEASEQRTEPKDEAYPSTSPWQIMNFDFEQEQKQAMIVDAFAQQGVQLPDFDVLAKGNEWSYRNKMEYSFWWIPETDKVELAFFQRGGRVKIPVKGSSLAKPELNAVVADIRDQINDLGILAKNLKTLLVRSNGAGEVVVSIFAKDDLEAFKKIEMNGFKGYEVWLSNPKSPASVRTSLLHKAGDTSLSDTLLGREYGYDAHSFFQVNLPIYEEALKDIKKMVGDDLTVDMYSGVGSIGLSVGGNPQLIEVDESSVKWAVINAGKEASVVHSKSEEALEYVVADRTLILDPPRAGLHKDLLAKIVAVKPRKLIYLSCDAATHARDVRALIDADYKLKNFKAYNFFPKTPHTETLALLVA